jgi:hypothetical protein
MRGDPLRLKIVVDDRVQLGQTGKSRERLQSELRATPGYARPTVKPATPRGMSKYMYFFSFHLRAMPWPPRDGWLLGATQQCRQGTQKGWPV